MTDVGAPSLTYDEAKQLAQNGDASTRATLAARSDIEPEILYFLARDPDLNVRRCVADNSNAPRHTYELLANDDSEHVRAGLAQKIAYLAPDLPKDECDKVWHSTRDALSALARDQIVQVRQVLAEALGSVENVPSDIIGSLARDAEIAVSGPVLENSPVLTDEDLLDIIQHGTNSANLSAISRRNRVSENVSDAIVDTNDVDAIAALLANDSSQIKEETLDMLIERAPDNELWHAPLVRRPYLPPNAPQRLATFLADHLIETLKARDDLDPKAIEEVTAIVKDRAITDGSSGSGGLGEYLEGSLPMDMVQRLEGDNGLPLSIVTSALDAEDYKFVLAAIVSRSNISEAICKRIFRERNPEAIASLMWKAKMPPSMLVGVQRQMARIAPMAVLKPKQDFKDDESGYPLGVDEMKQHLHFFADMVQREHNG